MDDILTPLQAAQLLGVSPATIKNWLRAKVLTSLSHDILLEFKKSGYEGRLSLRANKQVSERQFSPRRYGGSANPGHRESQKMIRDTLKLYSHLPLEEVLYYAVTDLISYKKKSMNNPSLQNELLLWKKSVFCGKKTWEDRPLFPSFITEWDDFPGWLYQSLEQEGSKSLRGSYFTPENAVEDILDSLFSHKPKKGKRVEFFDPSCGTGTFLCRAALKLNDPTGVTGQDIDMLAVRLARINLMLHFPHHDFEPQIFQGDSLLNPHPLLREKKFTHIATNPPWGYRFDSNIKKQLENIYALKALESSSCFILAILNHLSLEGIAGILLPESLLHRERHGNIRKRILQRTERINWYGKIFSRVQSECFALYLRGKNRKDCDDIIITRNNRSYKRPLDSLKNLPLGIWNIFTTTSQENIFKKMYDRPHETLRKKTQWGMGIVTGNNLLHLQKTCTNINQIVITGKELTPFNHKSPCHYLNYHDSRLQQKAPIAEYLTPKILYRFIADRPIMVQDKTGILTLNSVNYLIPDSMADQELIIMFFNSTLYGEYFKKTFHSLKVLRSHLEDLPLPLLNSEEKSAFRQLYPLLCQNYEKYKKELDNLVYDCLNITEKERNNLENDY